MESSTTLKRRRPFSNEGHQPVRQRRYPFSVESTSVLTPEERRLRQASAILEIPITAVRAFNERYHNPYGVQPVFFHPAPTNTFYQNSSPLPPAAPPQPRVQPYPPQSSPPVSDFAAEPVQIQPSLASNGNPTTYVFGEMNPPSSASFIEGAVGCLGNFVTCPPFFLDDGSIQYAAVVPSQQYTTGERYPAVTTATVTAPGPMTELREPYTREYHGPTGNWIDETGPEPQEHLTNFPALPATVQHQLGPEATQQSSIQETSVAKSESTETTTSYTSGMPTPVEASADHELKQEYSPDAQPVTIEAWALSPVASPPGPTTVVPTQEMIRSVEGPVPSQPVGPIPSDPRYNSECSDASHFHDMHEMHAAPAGMEDVTVVIDTLPKTYQRRGPFKDQETRRKTALTRKIGCCVRCRMQRIRCELDDNDPYGECQSCKKSVGRVWRLQCLRLKISDVALSKTTQVKGYEWTLRWKENTVLDQVGNWASPETRIIYVSEGYTGEAVPVKVRRFIPQDGDRLERSWVTPTGEVRSVRIPPFAALEVDTLKKEYERYIERGMYNCYCRVLGPHKLEGNILWRTYAATMELAQSPRCTPLEKTVLASVLKLWVVVRLTTRSFEIVGEDTLGMPPDILDETNPSCGKIPVPPVMAAQLDSVLIHSIQSGYRRVVLDGLYEMFTHTKARTWFVSYLVTFILLHNAALVIKQDASYARKHGINRHYAREDKVEEYHKGALTLLSHFHYCNKGVFPFTESVSDHDVQRIANLDAAAMEFVRETKKFAVANKSRFEHLWETNAFEDEFYYVSQLFEPNWKTRPGPGQWQAAQRAAT